MKKALLPSVLLFVTLSLCAQDYIPMLDDSNQWRVTNCYFGCNTDTYYTDGDTIVNGKSHKILDGYHYISRTLLLREDVEEKKVYFTRIININDIVEYPLYDFSKMEGDSVQMLNPITPFPEDGGYFLLDSIVSRPLVDGEDYRHFYFSPTQSNTISANSAIWIEGLGSLSIVNAPGGDPDINGVGHVSCFYKNENLFYSNLDSISGCEPLLSVNDIKLPLESVVSVYDRIKKSATFYRTSQVETITLHNLAGKFISQRKNNNSNHIEIPLGELSAGVYIISLYNASSSKRVFKLIMD